MPKLIIDSSKGLYQSTGTGVEVNGITAVGDVMKVYSHTASTGDLTLTTADSGCFVTVAGNAASQKINLPLATAAPGFHCTIMLTADPGNDLDVEETTKTNDFITINRVGGAVSDGLTGNTALRFDVSTPSVAGDIATIYSDGVSYIVSSQSTTAAAILAV